MAAYNSANSLTWAAMLNVTQFNSSIQSMVAQMAYAQRASSGLDSSLKSIATITFASIVAGIGGITAAIAISTKAAAEWETQMLDVAQLADINIKTPSGLTEYNKLSRDLLNTYADIPVQKTDLFTAVKPYAAANYTGDVLSNLTESTAKWHETSTVATDDISNMIIALAAINPGAVKAAGGIDAWANQVFSSMSRAANDAKITSQDIVSGITQSAGSLNKWGLQNQIPEQIALLTTMSQYGLDFGSWKTTLSSAVSGPGLTGPSTMTPELSRSLQSAGINIPYENLVKSVSAKGKVSIKSEKIQYKGYDIAAAIMGYEDADAFMDAYEKDAPTLMLNTIDKLKSLGLPTLRENELYGLIFGERAARELPKMGGTSAVEYYADMVKKVTGAYEEGSLATELYETKQSGLEAQWDKMMNRGDVVKTLLGDMFKGPVKERVESFSDSLKGTIKWLEDITDKATLPDGTLNSWKAIGLVVDGLKQKFVDLGGVDLLKAGGIAAGLLLIASNAGIVVTAVSRIPAAFAAMAGLIAPVIAGMSASLVGLAARVSAAFAGISIAPLIATAGSVVTAIAGIAVVAGTVALGLAAIGYSLAPEKFTYFNQVASEALNGVANVARQVYDDISRGDWGAAGEHLKTGFTNAIAWIQQINWNQLGGEIVTMIGDGANAIIGTALNIGGWIYDSLSKWVNGGGPRKLGEDIATFITDGVATISTQDYGQFIEDAINTASNWAGLGYDIISQIGSGFLSGVAGAMTPAANSMIQIVTQAALEIYEAFARTWNTIIALAAGAATSIGNAFSGVGNTIAGYLQPAIDAVESLVSKIAGINLPFVGNIGGAVGEVNPIVKYYNQDSGSSISVEQYNLRKAEGKNYKGYAPVRAYDQNQTTSKNVANIYDFIKSSDTFNKPLDVSTVTQPPTMSTTVREPEEFLYPGIPVIDTSGWNTNYAGYRTGGKGFVMDEMKSAGEGYSYLTTDLGEDITYLGDSFRMSNDELKKILPYLIDYPTNTKEISQDIADSVMPIPKDIRSASDYSKQTNTEINNAAKQAFREYDEVQTRASQTTKDSALYSSTKTITAADFAAARSERAAQYNESSSRSIVDFATSSYNGISNGLTQTGFGFSTNVDNAGNGLYNNTTSGGTQFFTDTTSGGKNAETSLITGANAIDSVAQKLSNLEFRFGGETGGDGDSGKKGSTGDSGKKGSKYVDPIIDRLGSVAGSVLRGFSWSELFKSSGTTTSAPDTMNVDNFEDMTCMGNRVMINALKYTPPGGETTSYNPMDSVSIRSASNVEGTFTDMTCIGTSITIPGLKYTNPYGNTSYINPSDYIAGGGVMDYQQTSAKKAGEITVGSAKTSSEYQKGATSYYAQTMETIKLSDLTASEYINALETKAAIENGNLWKNDLAFAGTAFAAPVNESTFNFSKMMDESVEQAFDYLGKEMDTNDKEYAQALQTIEKYNSVTAALSGAATQLDAASSKIESAGSNFNISVSSAMSSFMSGSYSMGGGFGGTSRGGGGAWVGTLPTPGWSGPAISTWVQSNRSGRWGNSSFSWGAKGSLIDEPSRIIAGEKGRELLLPNYLTELFLKLAAMGFNNRSNGDGNIITIVNIDGEQVEKIVSKRQKNNLNLRGLKLH